MRQEKKPIRVIIADTSSFVRLVLGAILNAEAGVEVVAAAQDVHQLLELTRQLRPDLVLLDLDLPGNSQLFGLKRLREECATPVLLLGHSEDLTRSVREEAKRHGVYDFIQEPSDHLRPQLRLIGEEIINKVRAVHKPAAVPAPADSQISMARRKSRLVKAPSFALIVGASTGGTEAVKSLVKALPKNFRGVMLVAVHMPQGFTHTLAARLQELTPLPVIEAATGTQAEAGQVIIARGGQDLRLHKRLSFHGLPQLVIPDTAASAYDRPSIDHLMQSAAVLFGSRSIGVVLTGMGTDGTEGLRAICEAGGLTIAQNEETSLIFGMPKSAIDNGCVNLVLPLPAIATLISQCSGPDCLSGMQLNRTSSYEVARTGV